MPKTHRRVRIINGKDSGVPNVRPHDPVVMVDGELLYGVTRIQMDHEYKKGGYAQVTITLIGVDVDLEVTPKYAVKVIGPEPSKED